MRGTVAHHRVAKVRAMRPAPRIAARVVAVCVLCFGACPYPSSAQSDSEKAAAVRLTVAPIPTAEDPSPGTPRVTWSTGDGSPGLVTVVSAGGGDAVFASGPSGSAEAPWITAGRAYEFRLYGTATGRRLLARAKVGSDAGAQTEVLALPKRPRDTPEVVDRLLQVLPFVGLVAFGVLATSWLREARRDD
jgi:hypothetical protein